MKKSDKVPTTFDELLDTIPGLRFRRSLNADMVRSLLSRVKGECTWCGQRVSGGRRTWCSDACVQQFHVRCSPQRAATFIMERDSGICGLCGLDTVEAERLFRAAWRKERDQHGLSYSQWSKAELSLKRQFGFGRGHFREVDHIVPVVEGGGLCTADMLRLICGACHELVTKDLSKRRSKKGSRKR